MRLITELTEDISTHLVEEAGSKRCYIEGVFLQSNVKNRNGRIYPSDIMSEEVQRYIKEKVKTGRALGELGHPTGPQINLDRVSHRIVELRQDGANWVGKALITEGTPFGAIAKGLIEAGTQLGVSSRGMGSLKARNGIMEVQNDFRLATAADIVADPSAPDAFVNGIMEGVEWVYERGVWKAKELEEARDAIDAAYGSKRSAAREEVALRLWESLVQKL